jgi:hypothetical protein
MSSSSSRGKNGRGDVLNRANELGVARQRRNCDSFRGKSVLRLLKRLGNCNNLVRVEHAAKNHVVPPEPPTR